MFRSTTFLYAVVLVAFSIFGCKKEAPNATKKPDADLSGVVTSGPNAKYERVENQPFLPRNIVAPESKKKTALIYYVADTPEPYFQAALSHEIRSLREACASRHENINWVAYVNSHYVVKKQFMKCNAGKFSIEDMKIEKLDEVASAIKDPDFDTQLKNTKDPRTALFSAEGAIKHPASLNKQYGDNPFVHPEVFRLLMSHAMTTVFPSKDFVFALNPKGHGSENFALTGLTQEQLEGKVKIQRDKITGLGLMKVLAIKYGEAGRDIDVGLEREIQKLGLGQLSRRPAETFAWTRTLQALGAGGDGLGAGGDGLGAGGDGLGAGGDGLGAGGDGLGAGGDGLGAGGDGLGAGGDGLGAGGDGLGIGGDGLGINGDGLGADNYFGIDIDTYFKVLGAVGRTVSSASAESKVEMSIIMMDSCSSNVRRSIIDILRMMPIMRYLGVIYSPAAALNYRSIDWNNWMYDWVSKSMTSAQIQQHFYRETPKIVNFKAKEQPKP